MDLTPERWHAFETAITESQIWTRGYSEIYEKNTSAKMAPSSRWSCAPRSCVTIRANHSKCGRSSGISVNAKKAQETLRISEERYRSLYDGMTDAYVAVKMDGTILHFNQAYQKMVGYDVDELHNLTYYDLTPEKWHAYEAEITENQVIRRGYSDIYEKEYIRKDGTIFPVELRVALIRGESGKPAGMWALIRDISVRKIIEQTLRDSEARYRELLENSMQGVIVFQNLRVVYTNQAVTESLGYSQAELNSLTTEQMVSLVHPDDRRTFLEQLQGVGKFPKLQNAIPCGSSIRMAKPAGSRPERCRSCSRNGRP